MKYGKLVEFHNWCYKCKHFKTPEKDEPCNTCLGVGGRDATHRPVKYEEKDNVK